MKTILLSTAIMAIMASTSWAQQRTPPAIPPGMKVEQAEAEILKPLSYCFHTTWMIDASRSVILRGGGWNELWQHHAILWGMALFMLVFGSLQVKKRL